MIQDYLTPIQIPVAFENFSVERVGGRILKHTQEDGFPDLDNVQIAIISVVDNSHISSDFRTYLYRLFVGNWNISIADLGNLVQGNTQKDTEFAVKEVVKFLISREITPILIGGKQENTYGMYRAFDQMEQMVNLVCVDANLDFGNENEFVCPQSYMSRILMESPTNLNHFTNIGYQTYYNAQEALDVLGKMCFEAYRLGEVSQHFDVIEVATRNADIVSVDMRSVQAADLDLPEGFPNGFTNREICAVTRYAGLSMHSSVFGIFEIPDTARALQLLAQMIWYFMEGYNYRIKEFPTLNDLNFTKIYVPCDGIELKFFKSSRTGRWWILPDTYQNGMEMQPCTESDYKQACKGVVPERWWNLHKKAAL